MHTPEGLLLSHSRAFSTFDLAHHRLPAREFSSQSSKEWDQDVPTPSSIFRKVSLK